MGVKMSKPPIFYTIGQVKLSPVLDMEKYVPKVQEELRKDFPRFKQDSINAFQLHVEAGTPRPSFSQIPRWQFARADNMSGFLLGPDYLVFHTTAYDTFEPFLESIVRGLEVVNKAASLGLVESMAIRTLDVAVPEPGTKVQEYLKAQACGLSEDFGGKLKQSTVECVREFPPDGTLISRVAILYGPLGIPMDLFPLALELKPEFKNLNTWHALIDNDRQQKGSFEFDVQKIRTGLSDVKKGVSEAFYSSVSDFAIGKWR
jgi:uncharacterized protein (TIGR04255 family)